MLPPSFNVRLSTVIFNLLTDCVRGIEMARAVVTPCGKTELARAPAAPKAAVVIKFLLFIGD
jgi:hypothetical protein